MSCLSSVSGILRLVTPSPVLSATHTLCGWFRQTSGADLGLTLNIDLLAGNDFEQIYSNGANWFFFTDLGAGTDSSVGGDPDNWTFLCWRRTPSLVSGAIDVYTGTGGALTKTTFAILSVTQGPSFAIYGLSTSSAFVFDGKAVGVRFWNGVALTDDEIAIEYMRLSPVVQLPNLFLFAPLVNGSNTTVDMSGNGQTMALTGSLSASRDMPPVPYGGTPIAGL